MPIVLVSGCKLLDNYKNRRFTLLCRFEYGFKRLYINFLFMKKINLRGLSEILSEKELKNVMGGSGDYGNCYSCSITAYFCDGGSHDVSGVFCGSDGQASQEILLDWLKGTNDVFCSFTTPSCTPWP